jgi:integrase
MTPFRAQDSKLYKLRVSVPKHLEHKPRTCSCGTTDATVADDVAAMVKRYKRRREYAPLIGVLEKRYTLAALYDADLRGAVKQLVAESNDRDLSPLVDELVTNAKYRKQIRALIPDGQRFPASWFRRARLSAFLDGLSCSNSTKNRYRAALSVFAGRLVEREIIEHNPVRDIRGKERNPVPFQYLRPAEFMSVTLRSDDKYKALFALLYGSGMEIGAALVVRRRDIDPERMTVWAHGTKTEHRDRECSVDPWAWQLLWEYARDFLPDAQLWTMRADTAWRYHQRRLKDAGLPRMRLHNTRHSFAVAARRRGESDEWIAQQLGHADSTMVAKVYGNYKPDAVAERRAAR